MWIAAAFGVGYYFGLKGGNERLDDIREAWEYIKQSDEVRNIAGGALSAVTGTVKQQGMNATSAATERMMARLATRMDQLLERRATQAARHRAA